MTTVTLTWDAWPSGQSVTGVSLQRATATAPTPAWSADIYTATTPTTFADTGLLENTLYTYQLRASNGIGAGPYTTYSITSANAAPGAPGSPTASNTATGINTCTVHLTWTASAAAGTSRTISNRALTSNYATLTTSAAHGFSIGQSVTVAGVPTDTFFNGTFVITAVPSTTTFTYAMTHANVASVASTGTAIVADIHATQPYEVFLNGVSQGLVNALAYDFTGLNENTTYTVGVRTKDTGGLFSSTASATPITTGNASPPTPTTLSTSGVAYNSVTLNWAAGTPAITDFAYYQVFINGGYYSYTYGTSFTFGGLTASTAYTFGVRTVDSSSAVSSTASVGQSTPANPDTTPPANATISSFQPEGTYGAMVLRGTWPADADFNYGDIQTSLDNASWVSVWTAGATPSTAIVLGVGTYSAGQTAYCRVNVRDATGNWRYGPSQSYSVIASPSYYNAVATNVWRNTNGGEYNNYGDYRPMQGYYSNAAWIARGMWYYDPTSAGPSGLYNSGRRTIVRGDFLIARSNNTGTSPAQSASFWMHDQAYSPGTVTGTGAPGFYGGPVAGPALGFNGAAWMTDPGGWGYNLVIGPLGITGSGYYGIGCYVAGQNPYMAMASLAQRGDSGQVAIYHLG